MNDSWWDDDVTFCGNRECANTGCERHYSKIDWLSPKHSLFGVSISLFAPLCPDYRKDEGVKQNNE